MVDAGWRRTGGEAWSAERREDFMERKLSGAEQRRHGGDVEFQAGGNGGGEPRQRQDGEDDSGWRKDSAASHVRPGRKRQDSRGDGRGAEEMEGRPGVVAAHGSSLTVL
jgi:hypothetical protein